MDDPDPFAVPTIDNAPVFSYSPGADAVPFSVPFGDDYVSSPVISPGYTLGNFDMEYHVTGRPADGVDSIYASGNTNRSSIDLSIDPTINGDRGEFIFPFGFRVGYELKVTVKAKVKSVPVLGFIISSRSPGDEVTFTFTYRVVDNGVDTDGDGVNDGLDLDIDGDGTLNVADPTVYGGSEIDVAFLVNASSSISATEFAFIKSAIKELMTGLHGLTPPGSPAANLHSLRYNITRYFHRGRVIFRDGKLVVIDDFRYPMTFNFSEEKTLSDYLAGADAINHLNSPDDFGATAVAEVVHSTFLDSSRGDGEAYTGSRAGVLKFIVYLGDGGVSSGDYPNLPKSYELASNNDINIISFGVADDRLNVNSLAILSKKRDDGIPLIFEEKNYASVKAMSEAVIGSIVAIEKAE